MASWRYSVLLCSLACSWCRGDTVSQDDVASCASGDSGCTPGVVDDSAVLLQVKASVAGRLVANATAVSTTKATPSDVMKCEKGAAVMTTQSMSCAMYDQVAKEVADLLTGLSSTCTANSCQQADWSGCVLRMAGHDFMDFKNGDGGSDACTDLDHIDNNGLAACLHSGEHGASLSDAYQNFCTAVSLADFLVIAAEAVMDVTRKNVPGASSMEQLKSQFRFGRTTATRCDDAAHRLPNPENGCPAVEENFINSLGLDWSGATALMGVHTLGKARIANSGYDGWWSDPENSRRFNNNYYVSLLAKGWMPERLSANKHQWFRSDQGAATNAAAKEMMLHTDLCLAYDDEKPIHDPDQTCCAWVDGPSIREVIANNGGEYCGGREEGGGKGRAQCCENNPRADDCGNFRRPNGVAYADVLKFAEDENAWLDAFYPAWKKVTENGFSGLKSLEGECSAQPTPQPAPSPSPGGGGGGDRPRPAPQPKPAKPTRPAPPPPPPPRPSPQPKPPRRR